MNAKRTLLFLAPLLLTAVILLTAGTPLGGKNGSAPVALPANGLAGEASLDTAALAVRIGITLGAIVVLIVGGIFVARWVAGRAGFAGTSRIEVLDRCFLAPKRALYSVRLGGRVVVVGVTETMITPVTELSPDEGEELYPAGADRRRADLSFPAVLRNVTTRLSRAGV